MPEAAELGVDAGCAVGAAGAVVDLADHSCQLEVALGVRRGAAVAPCVVAGSGDAENSAQPLHPVGVVMLRPGSASSGSVIRV